MKLGRKGKNTQCRVMAILTGKGCRQEVGGQALGQRSPTRKASQVFQASTLWNTWITLLEDHYLDYLCTTRDRIFIELDFVFIKSWILLPPSTFTRLSQTQCDMFKYLQISWFWSKEKGLLLQFPYFGCGPDCSRTIACRISWFRFGLVHAVSFTLCKSVPFTIGV